MLNHVLQSGSRPPPAILILGDSLDPNVMDSGSLSAAPSPKATGDAKVLSRRTFPGQGEVQEAVRVAPEGDTSAAEHMGEQPPWRLAMGAISNSAPNRIPFWRHMRLQNQASSLLRKKEVHLFCR